MRTTLFAAVSVLAMLSTSCQGLDMHGSRENELVFATGFEGETPFAGWQNAGSFATVDKGRNGGQALLTDFSANPKGEGGMVYYPLDIEKVRGCKIVVTCWVKAENVVKQKKRNMAVKVMLHSKSTKGPNWREQYNINGTFDWSRKAVTMDVPDCGTDVWLYFGLQGTTGKAWFDDVEVRVVRPLTLSDYKAPEGLPYKGHNLGRLRGAMSPSNPTVEDVNVLAGQWGANVMRYQMGIGWYKREKGIANDQVVDLAGYDEWLDFELAELDKLLPICRKYGMLVVVDMHSAPGGHGRIFAEKRYQDKFVECWERIARRYKGETSIWGYDFFNEPSDSTWDPAVEGLLDWQGLVQRVATAVRKIDQDVTFIVECADGANSVGFLSFLPIRDPKTVYSVHMYYPHLDPPRRGRPARRLRLPRRDQRQALGQGGTQACPAAGDRFPEEVQRPHLRRRVQRHSLGARPQRLPLHAGLYRRLRGARLGLDVPRLPRVERLERGVHGRPEGRQAGRNADGQGEARPRLVRQEPEGPALT
jgi:hypothetical protein